MKPPAATHDLTESLLFEAPTSVADDYGGVQDGWQERARCRARLRYLRGGETVQAARLQGRQPVVATVRRSTATEAIGTDWRMTDLQRGVAYAIRAIAPSEDRRWLEITAESGVGA